MISDVNFGIIFGLLVGSCLVNFVQHIEQKIESIDYRKRVLHTTWRAFGQPHGQSKARFEYDPELSQANRNYAAYNEN